MTDIPGTTLDPIEHWVSFKGVPVKMVDTAGIRDTADVVEKKYILRTLAEIRKADIVLHLLNASGDRYPMMLKFYEKVLSEVRQGVPLITVKNKADLCLEPNNTTDLCISAKQGIGLGS